LRDNNCTQGTSGSGQRPHLAPIVKSVQELYGHEQATHRSLEVLAVENDRLKARADKAEADSKAKDDAIAQLRGENNAEIGQLKAFLCSQFPTAPMCHP